ncbi:uncharacterized protein THITE_2038211, partial [Thermothielavioides terrestris NRRL 8126]
SLRQAALLFDIPFTTLFDRFNGYTTTYQAATQRFQRLTPKEEESLVKAIY